MFLARARRQAAIGMLKTFFPSSTSNWKPNLNRITPLILASALFMELMDSTVIATSLPAIAADIGTEPIALKLAMTSYLVALAIFIPLSGWMADRFGARNVFRWAIFVFMLGSLACAASNSLTSFVGARFFQGMGGAMMSPVARLVLVRSTERKNLVAVMAWMTTPALLGPVLGPPIGGYLTTFFSWHWIFWINIPIGAVGIIASTIFLPRTGYRAKTRLDWVGFILAGICFSGILFGLSIVSLPALPPIYGILAVVVGAISGVLLVRHARTVEAPIFNLSIFRNEMFRVALIGSNIFRISVGASPFLLPLMLQLAFGLTPFDAGMILLASAAGAVAAKLFSTWCFATFGFRTLFVVMSALSAAALACTGLFTAATPALLIMVVIFGNGIIRSIFFTGVNALSYTDIEAEDISGVTSINAVSMQLSTALGVALAGGILELSTFLRGVELDTFDFKVAFWSLASISLLAILPFLGLKADAGSAISGHHRTDEVS